MKKHSTHYLNLEGLNVRFPWSSFILNGKKTIETRSYPLPSKFVNRFISIIETYGTPGKHACIVGIVRFSGSKLYSDVEHWTLDQPRHLVSHDDPNYKFTDSKPKWGWEIDISIPLIRKVPAPKKKGIRFASNCQVPIDAVPEKFRRLLG